MEDQKSELEDGLEEQRADEAGRRPSWPYPSILFLYIVIFLIAPVAGGTIGLILFFGLMGACVWNAVSQSQYEKLKENYPDLPRSDYLFNSLIFPVIVPLIIFVLLMLFKFNGS